MRNSRYTPGKSVANPPAILLSMCGCDYANHVHGLLEGFGLEQNRLSADLIFATISVLRGKPHAQHDERSKDLSVQQFEALFDTGNKVTDAHMEGKPVLS